jgi:hypothetical protein
VPLAGTATSCTYLPTAATLTGLSILAFPAGSATIDIQTEAFSSFVTNGPGGATTIVGSGTTPAISSANGVKPSLAGFSTSIPGDTVVCFVLSSPSTSTKVSLYVNIQ